MESDTSTTNSSPEDQPLELSVVEARVLGSLMEKARTTPDIYPLTLNALQNACNQKTSREPVMELEEDSILEGLDGLREKGLVMRVDMAGSRTAKFRENVSKAWDLSPEEYALLTVLLLRGPQTGGQLRSRTDRLHPFQSVPEVIDWLEKMGRRDEEIHQLVQNMGRPPGSKEARYGHLLCGPQAVEAIAESTELVVRPLTASGKKLEELEQTVAELQERVTRLESLLQGLI
jgi:uncharacterized protein YceH (UPF0502 family)